MGFKDELKEFHEVVKDFQAYGENSKEIISEEDVLAALIVLNFIDYKKVPDLFFGKRLILGWIQLPQYKCHNCCET